MPLKFRPMYSAAPCFAAVALTSLTAFAQPSEEPGSAAPSTEPALPSAEASSPDAAEPAIQASPATSPTSQPSQTAGDCAEPSAPGDAGAPTNLTAPNAQDTQTVEPEFRRLALSPLTWDKEPGQAVGLGYETGAWSGWLGQGLRLTVPLGRHLAFSLRGLFVLDVDEQDDEPFTGDFGGKLDLIGRSPVYLNLVRLYGGGGVQVFRPTFNREGRDVRVGAGGHFGFEFFQSPHQSFFLEVGGQGPGPSPGVTILVGLSFYPWTK